MQPCGELNRDENVGYGVWMAWQLERLGETVGFCGWRYEWMRIWTVEGVDLRSRGVREE